MASNDGWMLLCLSSALLLHAAEPATGLKVTARPQPLHQMIALKAEPLASHGTALRLVPVLPVRPELRAPVLTPGCRF